MFGKKEERINKLVGRGVRNEKKGRRGEGTKRKTREVETRVVDK